MHVGKNTYTAILEIIMAFSRKLGINIPQDLVISLMGIYPKEAPSQVLLHRYVQISFIHNIQKVEISYMFLNSRMDKENVLHFHNGVLFSC